MKVEGKAAIVTGGGTGVGRETALLLASLGCSVLINYSKSRDGAEKTAADVSALGVKGLAVKADVRNDEDCRSMVKAAVSEFGHLDILVNNAGVTSFIKHSNLEGVGMDDWDRIMGTNVIGTFQVSRASRDALTASGNGEIVNVSSIAGLAHNGSSIPYCASKAAVNSLTVTLARVFAPAVRVNAVAPGFITTRWLKDGLGEEMYEVYRKATEEQVLLHRVCTPEDVAAAIVGIITGPDLMTGNIIPLEGGHLHSNFNPR